MEGMGRCFILGLFIRLMEQARMGGEKELDKRVSAKESRGDVKCKAEGGYGWTGI